MGCGDPKTKETQKVIPLVAGVIPIDVLNLRAGSCRECEHNKEGICVKQKEIYPDKPCDIRVGIMKPESHCPLTPPEWEAYPPKDNVVLRPQACVQCRRQTDRLDAKGVCVWCGVRKEIAHNNGKVYKETLTASDPESTFIRTTPTRRNGNPFKPSRTSPVRFVTSAQFQQDIKRLSSQIPHDVTAIVGVARSGLSAAIMIAMYRHLPLLAYRQTKGDMEVISAGNGWRLGGSSHIAPGQTDRVCIIDDTVMTGNSMTQAHQVVGRIFPNNVSGAVYVNPEAHRKPTFWAVDLPWPHILEWNVFNSVLSPNIGCDFDGILCYDCPAGSDDDGPRYRHFIENAKPLYLPRKTVLPLIVTARVEKYRALTVQWLHKHGVHFKRLVMHPAATTAERNRHNIAKFKAEHFERWARHHRPRPKPLLFIESDDRQAREIARRTQRLVVSPHAGMVYK